MERTKIMSEGTLINAIGNFERQNKVEDFTISYNKGIFPITPVSLIFNIIGKGVTDIRSD